MTHSQSDMERIARHVTAMPDPRTLAASEADDVREFNGMPRKHSREHYARLLNGGACPDDDAPSPGLTVWVLAIALIVIFVAIGITTMPATPAPYVGPGFENCQGSC